MGIDKNALLTDVANIGQIPIVTTILDVICKTTGMGFAAVARVTENTWMACSVKDNINFGLKPGGELVVDTTICHEIRQNHHAVIIDEVRADPLFKDHHTPAMYGFQSYISIPIFKKDGSFFGTLCSIDPDPHILNTAAIKDMFYLFADLISFHLQAVEELKASTQKILENTSLIHTLSKELQALNYISSHDLQEPLRKIQTFVSILSATEQQHLSEKGQDYFLRLNSAASRMQLLIDGLMSYADMQIHAQKLERTSLADIISVVQDDLRLELEEKKGTIQMGEMPEVQIIPVQFRQLLYNIFSNSLKFSAAGRNPMITVESKLDTKAGHPDQPFYHLSVSDNGIGFHPEYAERIFDIFQRLHDSSVYPGTGMGLTIARKIVSNHKGHIKASGKENEGTTVDIYIPA